MQRTYHKFAADLEWALSDDYIDTNERAILTRLH